MRRRRTTILLSCLYALVFLRADTCGPDILENPGFDLWCGEDTLCAWENDGAIEQVPTWHSADYGVALIDPEVRLSQLADLGSGRPDCFDFELLAHRGDDAEIFIEMDFQDDGTIEYSHPIPETGWAPVEYEIAPPSWYTSVRFIVRKVGTGRAVLAQIRVRTSSECAATPLELNDRPDGAACERDDQCASGICAGAAPGDPWAPAALCASCRDEASCEAGEACGLDADAESADGVIACGPAERHGLGERCVTDGECATGNCCEGLCSGCCDDSDCTGGARCEVAPYDEAGDWYQLVIPPHQCDPRGGTGAAGTACSDDADCASGSCTGDGDLNICGIFGWRCEDRPCDPVCDDGGDCHELCRTVGERHGECD